MHATGIRSRFEADGVVRLQGAFTAEQAAGMREAVWRHAGRQAGLRPGDPASWAGSPVLNWQGLKRDPAFRPLAGSRPVSGALDAIFGTGGWQRPRPGAQILFSLPEPGPWVLPDAWHMDCGFEQATWPVRSVKLFAFMDEVGPRGGGTMLLPGTHQLVDRYREGLPAPARRTAGPSCVIIRGWAACSTALARQAMAGRWSGRRARSTACRSRSSS
jgi:hypothetical protein